MSTRGRPYRLPVDPTPLTDLRGSNAERIAWLLGVSRLYAQDHELATRRPFLDRLRELGVTADATRLSRWEAGQAAVSHEVLGAYEKVLGIVPGSLTTGVLGVVRAIDPPCPRPAGGTIDAMALHAQLDDALERALAGEATGQHWLDLCHLITSQPLLYLRQATWSEITDLLAVDLSRSRGLDFLARFEALRLLVVHPASRRHAVRAIGAVVTNPATEFAVHPLALLQEVDDSQALELLIRLVHDSPSYLRSGAAWALAGAQLRGELDDDLAVRLEALTLDLLQRGRTHVQRLDPLSLYAAMGPTSRERLALATVDGAAQHSLALVSRSAEIVHPTLARRTATQVATAAQERMQAHRPMEADQMLHRLVREALFHALHHRRHQARLLLTVSPYRGAVADELLGLTRSADETVTVMALNALHLLAEPRHRSELWMRATRELRPAVRAVSLMTFGQVVDSLSAAEVDRLCTALTDGEVVPAVALHVIGLAGAAEKARASLDAHSQHHRPLAWWQDNPPVDDIASA